jgi:hypothetical protein
VILSELDDQDDREHQGILRGWHPLDKGAPVAMIVTDPCENFAVGCLFLSFTPNYDPKMPAAFRWAHIARCPVISSLDVRDLIPSGLPFGQTGLL